MKSIAKKRQVRKVEMVNAPITLWEAALIKKLRQYQFGKLTVSVERGNPIFVAIRENKVLEKDEGLELDGAIVIDPLEL